MDSTELERITADASVVQALLESMPAGDTCPRLKAARDASERIKDCCERLSKRTRCSSHLSTACGSEDDKEKASLVEQSKIAGEALIPFGKHKGTQIKAVPKSYLCWLLGMKRVGREFEDISMDKHGWIIANHPNVVAQVKSYLTWRCWACGSIDTRFKFSRLCTECWHGHAP
jgi:hypothetical protein